MQNSILIVDDEKPTRDNLAKYLSDTYEIYTASNGYDAIQKVTRHDDIKLILSDIKMPEMDGIKLMQIINSYNKDIRTIFITGTSSIKTAADAMRRGAYHFLSKPVDLNKLDAAIRNALADKKRVEIQRTNESVTGDNLIDIE